ncbi:esterase, partial [Streptomyces anthocyanicus]
MGLTSGAALVTAVAAALALFAVTVLWWPRLARRGWRPVLGRVGLLFATQLA